MNFIMENIGYIIVCIILASLALGLFLGNVIAYMYGEEPDGPEFSDGHDCEGFIGGCKRFGCPGGIRCTKRGMWQDVGRG